ncbi:MAG TPA: 3-deoxy-7-phosphoheptulonate synthase [Candidatus Eremiobacteraceae bacterium]|nr:3-deoxy-7-phosphoheptulonate synthase [Candidatus Eremiobacteraceae bacterium]
MIVVMKSGVTPEQTQIVVDKIASMGYGVNISQGAEKLIIGVLGVRDNKETLAAQLGGLPYVERVMPISKAYKLVSREGAQGDTIVRLRNGVEIGGASVHVMAGPCTVEGREMLVDTARWVKQCGATLLRGGAYKPSTSPYSFQGMGKDGLEILAEARSITGLPVITEVLDPRDVPLVEQYADVLQIGARNMQNFNLLKECAKSRTPVMLKRGLSATVEEWLLAAEYIYSGGNHDVILCERGIRTFETATRNTLDLNAVPLVKQLTHLPIVVDPSHGTGKWDLVTPMARAGIAAGADGLIIEVHPNPSEALKDGFESLTFERFAALMDGVRAVSRAVGRHVATDVAASV